MPDAITFKQFDTEVSERLKFKRDLEENLDRNYLAFYEKIVKRSGIGNFAFSALLFCALFVLQLITLFSTSGSGIVTPAEKNFQLAGMLLPLLNGVGFFLILSATDKLREFITNLINLSQNDYSARTNKYLQIFKTKFLRYRLVYYGAVIGVINVFLACCFGIPTIYAAEPLAMGNFILQVFLVGFLGGITVCATILVIRLIATVSVKDNIKLMYMYPDKCAGTLVIGDILFTFSIHFIVIGILIFAFLQIFPWTREAVFSVKIVLSFWKMFPFILSAIIFFIPAKKINRILKEYKLSEQLRIRMRMNFIGQQMISIETTDAESAAQLERLDAHIKKLQQLDEYITQMATWPYNLRYRTTFLAIFLPALVATGFGIIQKILEELIH